MMSLPFFRRLVSAGRATKSERPATSGANILYRHRADKRRRVQAASLVREASTARRMDPVYVTLTPFPDNISRFRRSVSPQASMDELVHE